MGLRKRNRLNGYDYNSVGYYFITICTQNKEKLFWKNDVPCREPDLSEQGKIVNQSIQEIEKVYSWITVDKYVVMPNHVHLLLRVDADVGVSISVVIGNMKRAVSRQVGAGVWQKSFHDHVIRGERDYLRIWEYIDGNPQKWSEDCFFET